MAVVFALAYAFGAAITTAIAWYLLIYYTRSIAGFVSSAIQQIVGREPEQVFSDEKWESFYYKSTATISFLGFVVNFFAYIA
jgi:hypothetical protein